MDSINTLNNSGIQTAESISESAKQNLLLAQQLANQKKSEINEPLNMIGAELLTGGISGLGKSVAKRTGIKSFEKLGKEDLAKTLVSAGKEVSNKVIKKGGQVIKDKLGTNIDDYLKRGKKFAVDKINAELKNKGISAEINEGDLNDMKGLQKKLNTFRQQAQTNVTDKLSEVGQDLKSKAEQTGVDVNKAIDDRFGLGNVPPQGLKEKIQNDIREKQAKLQSTKERVESQARGRDVGEGIDDQDKATQKILGDLQEGKAKSLLKQTATGKRRIRFADPNIEDITSSIDDLPEFTKKVQKEVGAPEELGEAREVSLFDPLNKPFQKTFKNNIEAEATLDDQDDIENTYVSKAQKAIQQSEVEANPVQKFIDSKPTFTAPKVTESQYLDQLPSLEELTETKDQKILRLQKERVNRGISQKASEDLGKKPSELFADDPRIKDPTTLTEGDVASLGRTSAKVKAQIEKKVEPEVFDPKDLPPPPSELLEPEKQALQLQESQISEPKITEQTVDEPEVQALQKEAPEVEKSEADAAKALKPKPTGLDEDVEDLGKADLAEGGEDIGGDILEGILGIASLVIPSELEGHGDLNNHNAIFSSSFQAGATA